MLRQIPVSIGSIRSEQSHPVSPGFLRPEEPGDFGQPEAFVPQKEQAKRRLLVLATVGGIIGIAAVAYLLI